MTVKTRSELKAENSGDFPNNQTRLISPADLRGQMDDTADSMLMDEDIAGLDLSEAHVTAIGDGTQTLAEWTSSILSGEAGDFSPPWTGAITWPVTQRMQQQVYLLDFIPVSEHAAIRAGTSTYDCADAFENAMNSVSVETDNPAFYDGGAEVIFPYGTCYFSRTLEIKKTMTLTGHGIGARTSYSSRLLFAPNITGITVNSLTTFEGDMDPPVYPIPGTPHSQGGNATVIRGLKLSSQNTGVRNPALNETGFGVGNGIGHGIWVRGTCRIEQCIIQYFPQHGIYIRAAAVVANTPDGRSIYGNANLTQINHVASISNAGCGLYIDGPDTNACTFIACDLGSNKLSGVHESSLIGNTHIGPHTDNNGTDALCSYAVTPGVTQMARYYCRNVPLANGQAAKWAPSTAYSVGNLVTNVGLLFQCSTAGTSAVGGAGPVSKVQGLADGTVVWDFVYAENFPTDILPRIPPTGHADSATVWGFIANTGGPVGTIDNHPSYPLWPYLLDGVTLKIYRYGYNYWFDQSSATNVIIQPYTEGGQPKSLIVAPTILIGIAIYDDASTGIKLQGATTGLTVSPAMNLPSTLNSTRDFITHFNRGSDEAISFQTDGDGATPVHSAVTWGYIWDNTTGTWMIQHARSAARIAQRFTTTLNTITGGRTAAIGAGNTLFTQGAWIGSSPANSRHLSMMTAAPTTGEWAAGDLVLNAAPLVGEPWGWRCILTGDFAATPPVFQPLRDLGSQETLATNADFTRTPGTSAYHTKHTGTLTADRAATLSKTGALVGLSYKITRTGSGAFNLNVLNGAAGPTLKALTTNTWGEFAYDGTDYYLAAYGAL
jgi:hypothetical protein